MSSQWDDEDGEDDGEAQLNLKFTLVPQCHNCKNWWPNMHSYKIRHEAGTCDLDGARTIGKDTCGFWEDYVEDGVEWWYYDAEKGKTPGEGGGGD